LHLAPGSGTLDELLAGIDDGLYLETTRSWSIDARRLHFQFGCEIAWEVKGGRRTRLVRNPSYQGVTPTFWGSCDGVAGPSEWRLFGFPNCGKGEPLQIAEMSHGCSPARFRGVSVGVAGR
jgi:TldD protein